MTPPDLTHVLPGSREGVPAPSVALPSLIGGPS